MFKAVYGERDYDMVSSMFKAVYGERDYAMVSSMFKAVYGERDYDMVSSMFKAVYGERDYDMVFSLFTGSTRTVPIHIVPTGPPAYSEPSHKPPSYEEAVRHNNTINTTHNASTQQVPGLIAYYNDDYGYQPPRKYFMETVFDFY